MSYGVKQSVLSLDAAGQVIDPALVVIVHGLGALVPVTSLP